MKVFNSICIEDHTVLAQNGDRQDLVRGKEYTISGEKDGIVTVFSSFRVKVPATLFAGTIPLGSSLT